MDRKKLYPWYFTSGALVIFFLLCFLPGIIGIFYSFTDWNNFSSEVNFVGLKNYIEVFRGKPEYRTYIWNTVTFTVVTTAFKNNSRVRISTFINAENNKIQKSS